MTQDQSSRERKRAPQRKKPAPAAVRPSLDRARELIRERAERVTGARVAILSVLLDSTAALSHHEILDRLGTAGEIIDRVTVYRTLEWLVKVHLAHRISSESRAWHFSAHASSDHDEAHAHFECRQCERVYCIESASPPATPTIPNGFEIEQTQLKFEGTCANCTQARTQQDKRPGRASRGR